MGTQDDQEITKIPTTRSVRMQPNPLSDFLGTKRKVEEQTGQDEKHCISHQYIILAYQNYIISKVLTIVRKGDFAEK